MSPRYTLRTLGRRAGTTVDIERDVIARVDPDHADTIRAMQPGDEYEIPQVGCPAWYVLRVS